MLDKNTPVVPSLQAFSDPLLRTPENVAIYLIQFMFANPGRTSSVNEGEMLSWRRLAAEYGGTHFSQMANQMSTMLTAALSHYFPNGDYTANCTINQVEGFGDDGARLGTCEIVINIVDADSNPIIPTAKWRAAIDGSNYSVVRE
jgi:hypothetical protein